MAKRVSAFGNIINGDLRISHEADFRAEVAKLKGRVRVVVEGGNRKQRQNALYWVWNQIVGRELGYSKEEIHAINKSELNTRHITWTDKRTGEIQGKSYPMSTANLTIDNFAIFMESVQQFWAEKGIQLPSGEEQ